MRSQKVDMNQRPYHVSVLVDEVLTYLAPKSQGIYVDATFGGGGHTQAILESVPDCIVIAMDWDAQALEKNGSPLQEQYPDRLTLIWANFAQIDRKLKKIGIKHVDGVLADFGTSQYQLFQRPGFSFAQDTPLDMRMSPAHQKITAAQVVNQASEKELVYILQKLGEQPFARSIARAIIQARKEKPIRTTRQLAALVEKVLAGRIKKRIHPATQTFQALRMYVNNELDNIKAFLPAALRMLKPGGRLVCITFHSLEDRLVKDFFKAKSSGYDLQGRILTPKAIIPSDMEIAHNPAARSAKLRAFQRL